MKRFHIHVAVTDLEESTRFYAAMFGAAPTVVKPDYAKWMLDDPRINFAISARGSAAGLNHLGFQADSNEELEEIHARLQNADSAITAEKGANCCYAKSDKYWVQDPSGIAWESFHSLNTIPVFGEHTHPAQASFASGEASASSGCATSCCPAPVAKAAEKIAAKSCCNG